MFRECSWHKVNFKEELDVNGQFILEEIEPFDNKDITSGMCKRCSEIALFEIKGLK